MKTLLNIKTDKDVKDKAKKVAEELGLPLSTILNAYLKEFVRNRSVYFSTIPQMSPRLEKLLGEVEKDIKTKRNFSRPLSSSKEVSNYLDNL